MAAFGSKVILPGDPDWFIPDSQSLYILACAAVGADAMVFSAALDLSEPYSRFYRYEAGRWLCVEISASIGDMVVLQPPPLPGEGLVVLGEEGEVWFVGREDTRTERIQTTDGGRWRGTLGRLRHIAGTFYALGLDGQCYRRDSTQWLPDDGGVRGFEPPFPRKRPGDVGQVTDVCDIATLPNGDQYLCGTVALARPAIFWRPGGIGRWNWLGYAVDDPAYDYLAPVSMLVEPPGTVWVTTRGGIMVKGNAAQGFRIASDVAYRAPQAGGGKADLAILSNAVFYGGSVYAGSNLGPFRLRANGSWEAAAPQSTQGQDGYPFAAGRLDVSDGVLWAFGMSHVARYDGHQWKPVSIPDLYR